MQDYKGKRSSTFVVPLFVILDTICMSVTFSPQPNYLRGERHCYPSNRRLNGSPSRTERCREERNNLALAGNGAAISHLFIPRLSLCIFPLRSEN